MSSLLHALFFCFQFTYESLRHSNYPNDFSIQLTRSAVFGNTNMEYGRAANSFWVRHGIKFSWVIKMLQKAYGHIPMSMTRVSKRYRQFQQDRNLAQDNPRPGAPVTAVMEDSIRFPGNCSL